MMAVEPTFQKGKQHGFFRVQNRIGAQLDRLNIRFPITNIDEAYLYRKAMEATGLTDFGDPFFREPLHVMLEAARTEGHLTWSGRRSARVAALGGLKYRLWAQESVRRNPDILDQPVRRPLIVVGAPRTGTTLMNHLLALDPAARPLLMWEAFQPTPWRYRRDGRGDPRPLACRMSVPLAKKFVPELAVVHDFGWNVPDECQWLFWPTFVWPPAMVMPSYRAWLKQQPDALYEKVYGEYRRAIQMLHWQRPAESHWVLKSPLHAWALPSLMKAVPEANVVQTHRNLRDVIPSFCSLGSVLATIYTDAVEPKRVGPLAMELARDAVDRVMAYHDHIDASRLFNVNYATLVKDPVGHVQAIYGKFGYTFTPEYADRIQRFLAEKSANRPRHVYSMEQFGLDAGAIDREFAAYHQRFGLDT
jgi:hypothetical protein